MSPNDELARLATLIAEFEKLDASIPEAFNKRNLDEVFDATSEAKKKIKRLMSQHGPLNVGAALGLKLKKIRDNYGYNIDLVVEAFKRKAKIDISQEAEEEIDWIDALFTEGTGSYVDENFFRRRNEVGTLIVSESLPDNFRLHFQNLRECYTLGLFEATVIYCRAIIEIGCFERLRRRGELKLDSKIEDIREFSLKVLMRSIKPLVYRENWEKADKVIKKADSVLHSKREKVIVREGEAFDAIKDTFAIVEELFSQSYQHKGKR